MGAKLNMDTGGEIINCAAKLFAKRGVGSVSLRDIADELGISKGTLHYYFKTKEDLIKGGVNVVEAAKKAKMAVATHYFGS